MSKKTVIFLFCLLVPCLQNHELQAAREWPNRCIDCCGLSGCSIAATRFCVATLLAHDAWESCRQQAAIGDPCGAPDYFVPMVTCGTATLCFSAMAACFAKKVLKED